MPQKQQQQQRNNSEILTYNFQTFRIFTRVKLKKKYDATVYMFVQILDYAHKLKQGLFC